MNREIKFRGKSKNSGEWLYGYLFNYELSLTAVTPCINICIPASLEEVYSDCTVYSDTIGQYTGLRDKDGKEIYEGDIVYIGSNLKAVVIWFNGSFRFKDELSCKATYFEDIGVVMRDYDVCIIGNIYDNPELLKGGDE